MSSFKKNASIEELQKEIELLQGQVVTANAKLKSINKTHPAVLELAMVKSKWWFKLFTWIGL